MGRARVNPFDQGTAERVLFDHYRRYKATHEKQARAAAEFTVAADASKAAMEQYAQALRALGHGDKVPGQVALPAPQTHGG